MNNLYVRLHNFLYTCERNSADFMIARTLIKEYDYLKDILIETIAMEAMTTPATVTKFIHKLGYKSFRELKGDSTALRTDKSWTDVLHTANKQGFEEAASFYLKVQQEKLVSYYKQFQQDQIKSLAQSFSVHNTVGVLYSFYGYTSVHAFREYLRPFHIPVHGILKESDEEYLKFCAKDLTHIFVICLSGEWIYHHTKFLERLKDENKRIILTTQTCLPEFSFVDYHFMIADESENILHSAIQISYLFAQIALAISSFSNFGKK